MRWDVIASLQRDFLQSFQGRLGVSVGEHGKLEHRPATSRSCQHCDSFTDLPALTSTVSTAKLTGAPAQATTALMWLFLRPRLKSIPRWLCDGCSVERLAKSVRNGRRLAPRQIQLNVTAGGLKQMRNERCDQNSASTYTSPRGTSTGLPKQSRCRKSFCAIKDDTCLQIGVQPGGERDAQDEVSLLESGSRAGGGCARKQ